MPIIPNNVDWSATAAWIALIISITGTIAGPLITSLLNHRHELKMHQLRAKEEEYIQKQTLLRQCISGIGVFYLTLVLQVWMNLEKPFIIHMHTCPKKNGLY